MKKQIIAIALISGLTFAGVASAHWGQGGGQGGCPKAGMMQGQMMNQQLDQATKDKIAQFFKDNQELRKEMTMKRAVKKALMQSEQPDVTEIAKVTGELFDLRTAMHEKAVAAGVDQYVGKGRGKCGMGSGGGRGMQQ